MPENPSSVFGVFVTGACNSQNDEWILVYVHPLLYLLYISMENDRYHGGGVGILCDSKIVWRFVSVARTILAGKYLDICITFASLTRISKGRSFVIGVFNSHKVM